MRYAKDECNDVDITRSNNVDNIPFILKLVDIGWYTMTKDREAINTTAVYTVVGESVYCSVI